MKRPRVSDHAIVRYLERVKGMDIKALKKEILSDGLATKVRQLGDGYYPVKGKYKIRVKDGVVVTVLKPQMSVRRRGTGKQTTRNRTLLKAEKRRNKRLTESVREAEQMEEADL